MFEHTDTKGGFRGLAIGVGIFYFPPPTLTQEK
jgi:hypothetical protein